MPKAVLGVGYNLTPNIELTASYGHTFGKTSAPKTLVNGTSSLQPPLEPLVDTTSVASSNEVMAGVNVYF